MTAVGKYLLLGGLLAALMAESAVAAEIFQWRDESGRLHFVDNPSKVPPQYRKSSKRGLDALESVSSQKSAKSTQVSAGGRAWEAQCAGCHFVGEESGQGKLGLDRILINNATAYPAAKEDVVYEFRRAADGRFSDMAKMEVSDGELEAIAEYLLNKMK